MTEKPSLLGFLAAGALAVLLCALGAWIALATGGGVTLAVPLGVLAALVSLLIFHKRLVLRPGSKQD